MSQISNSHPPPPTATPVTASSGPAVAAFLAAGALVLGAATPALSFQGFSSGAVFEGGAPSVGLILVVCGGLLMGLGGRTSAVAAGIAGGAGAAAATLSLLFLAIWFPVVRDASVTPGPGFFGFLAAAVLGFVVFVMSVGRRGHVDERRYAGPFAAIGMAAAIATTAGIMMPPPDSGISFTDANFSIDDAGLQIAYLLFVATPAVVGLIGYGMRTRWGAGLALGAIAPYLWLTAVAVFEIEGSTPTLVATSSFGSTIPPLLWVGLGGQIVALFFAFATMSPGNGGSPGSAGAGAHSSVPQTYDGQPSPPPPPPPGHVDHQAPPPPPSPSMSADDAPPPPPSSDQSGLVVTPQTSFVAAEPMRVQLDEWWVANQTPVEPRPSSPFAPPVDHQPDDDITVIPSARAAPSLPGPVGRVEAPMLVVSDGQRVAIDRMVVIGRDPVAAPDDSGAALLALGPRHLDISKSHAAVGVDDDGSVWLEDRHSTNGVELVSEAGSSSHLVPGRRTPWPDHTTMVLGDIRIELEQ